MRHLLLPVDDPDRELPLAPEISRRLRKVLRLSLGARVEVVDSRGRGRGEAELTHPDRLEILSWRPLGTDPHPDLRLYLPALKGDRLEWAAQRCFELGLRGLGLFRSQRAQLEPPPRLLKRLDAVAVAACEQSGRAHIPAIENSGALGDLLRACGEEGRRLVVLHPGAGSWPPPEVSSLALLVGPEGGFDGDEVARLEQAGASLVGLGGHVLRAETAAVAGTTLALARLGWLGGGASR